MSDDQLISAGEFARRTGLSRKTLRGYEDRELLVPVSVDPANGFRYYSTTQVRLGRLLAELRSAHVPRSQLAEIVATLGEDMGSPSAAAEAIKTFLYREARVLRDHQATVHRVIDQLSRPREAGTTGVEMRRSPARLAIVGFEVCDATTIDPAAAAWAGKLHRLAGATAAGPLFMRFVEPVTLELAGRVEFGLPVDEIIAPPPGCALHHAASSNQATVVVGPSEDPYPEIRAALEEILQWHIRNENDILGTAPEVHTETPGKDQYTVAWPFS